LVAEGKRYDEPVASRREKVVVLLSGGMDSCVAAAIAASRFDVAALHSDYGQRTEARERQAFEAISDRLGIAQRLVIDQRYMAAIGGSALTDNAISVPDFDADSEAPRAVPVTYVPFRNAHFLSAAISWAEVIGASRVFIGAVEQDSSGYPDCRPEYYQAFQTVSDVGTRPETSIRIETPLIRMSKAEIIRQGLALGAPLELSWSCYQQGETACGRCDSCALRLRAFEIAGSPDPAPYNFDGAGVPDRDPNDVVSFS
jgi:7-cyano-7-deazaguanine synthase